MGVLQVGLHGSSLRICAGRIAKKATKAGKVEGCYSKGDRERTQSTRARRHDLDTTGFSSVYVKENYNSYTKENLIVTTEFKAKNTTA